MVGGGAYDKQSRCDRCVSASQHLQSLCLDSGEKTSVFHLESRKMTSPTVKEKKNEERE